MWCASSCMLMTMKCRNRAGLGFGMWSAISNFIDKVHTLGVFAECYQCAAPAAANATAAINSTAAG